jgi:hypothetical protein
MLGVARIRKKRPENTSSATSAATNGQYID